MGSASRLLNYWQYADFYAILLLKRIFGRSDHYARNGEFALARSLARSWLQSETENDSFCYVDVGAERGVHATHMLDHFIAYGQQDKLQLHAIEPFPDYASVLRDRFHGLSSVSIHSVALGVGNDRREYFYEKNNEVIGGPRSLFKHPGSTSSPQGLRRILVEQTSLDELSRRLGISHINFLKIDAEGSELDILRGSLTLLQEEMVDYIQFEYSHLWVPARASLGMLFMLLGELKYDLFQILPISLRSAPSYHPLLDNYRLANYLLIRRGMPHPLPCKRKIYPFL